MNDQQELTHLRARVAELAEQGRWLDAAVDRYREIETIIGRALPLCPVVDPAWECLMPHDWNWKHECRRCGVGMRSAILSAGEYEGNSAQHWAAKAKAYGGMVRNSEPALRAAGHPVNASGDGGAVEGIRAAIQSLAAERDELQRELQSRKSAQGRMG